MDYNEILLMQARQMGKQLADLTGKEEFDDERFFSVMHKAFCIVRNDTIRGTLTEQLDYTKEYPPTDTVLLEQFIQNYAIKNEILL